MQYFWIVSHDIEIWEEDNYGPIDKVFLQSKQAIEWGRREATKHPYLHYSLYKQPITRTGRAIFCKPLLPFKKEQLSEGMITFSAPRYVCKLPAFKNQNNEKVSNSICHSTLSMHFSMGKCIRMAQSLYSNRIHSWNNYLDMDSRNKINQIKLKKMNEERMIQLKRVLRKEVNDILNKQSEDVDILAEAFMNLTEDDIKRITTEEKINRKRALEIAAVYNLDFEVKFCMDFCGMSPIEALAEWDLL